jgi:hypothetical protein
MNLLARAMTEDQLLTAAVEALTIFGWRWTHPRRSDKALTMGDPGLPDIIAVKPPDLLFVEVKSHAGRLSEAQSAWMADIRNCPAVGYFLLRPDTLDTFIRLLQHPDFSE